MHSQWSSSGKGSNWSWDFGREMQLYQCIQGTDLTDKCHPNIVRVTEMIPAAQNGSHGPACIMDKIEPLAYDLFSVHRRYCRAAVALPLFCCVDLLISSMVCFGAHLHLCRRNFPVECGSVTPFVGDWALQHEPSRNDSLGTRCPFGISSTLQFGGRAFGVIPCGHNG